MRLNKVNAQVIQKTKKYNHKAKELECLRNYNRSSSLKIIRKNEIWLTKDILPNITWNHNAFNLKEIRVRKNKTKRK